MINQFVLFNQYNFDTQNPKYEEITEKAKNYLKTTIKSNDFNIEQTILNQYNNIWKFIYQKLSPGKEFKETIILPAKLGLIVGLILRHILGDNTITKDFILTVYQAIENRNQSIFAHGINSISKKNCGNLKSISEKMINLNDIEENLKNKIFNKKSIDNLISLFKNVL